MPLLTTVSLRRLRGADTRPAHRPARSPVLLLLALLAVCTIASTPVYGFVYITTPSSAQLPAAYAAANPTQHPTLGLFDACSAQTKGTVNQMVLTVRGNISGLLATAAGTNTLYLGGYYDPTANQWFWSDGRYSTYAFATGVAGTPVSDMSIAWATGYPATETAGVIGSLRYVVYDGTVQKLKNVAGTAALNGVACESGDAVVNQASKGFPWWAILIIVIAVVVIVVIVIVVVCCCCCRKKKSYDDADDEDSSAFTSRSGSFVSGSTSRGTSSRASSYSGSQATSTASSSFSSRGKTRTEGSSFASGTTDSDGSSFTSSAASSSAATSTNGSGGSSYTDGTRSTASSR